jgi:hypothetical protein
MPAAAAAAAGANKMKGIRSAAAHMHVLDIVLSRLLQVSDARSSGPEHAGHQQIS